MTRVQTPSGRRIAVLALAAASAVALGACEEHAYPSAAPRESTAAPAQEDALAGAPQGYAPPPTTRTPAYVPPPAGYPPSGEAQEPGPDGYPAPPPPPGYAPGYGHGAPNTAPPVVISMAPIPNPPEPSHHVHAHRRHPAEGYAPAYAHPRRRHHHPHALWMTAPRGAHAPVHRHHAAPATHRAPVTHPAAHPAAPAPRPAPAPAPQLAKPAAPSHHHRRHGAPAAATAAAASPVNTLSNTAATGSEADRYQALQKSLHDDYARTGRLDAPAHMEANQPVDVTLTLPADFAQTVQSEAGKEGLGQAALTVNLTSALSGDGYTIVPADPQTLPLVSGQPTVFRWKVTPTAASRGALSASMKLQPAGDTHALDLGVKSTGQGSATGRVVGIGLLALIALLLLGWAAQRRRPAPTGATKPRPAAYNQPNL